MQVGEYFHVLNKAKTKKGVVFGEMVLDFLFHLEFTNRNRCVDSFVLCCVWIYHKYASMLSSEPARFYCMLSANRKTIHYSEPVAESFNARPSLAQLNNHCLSLYTYSVRPRRHVTMYLEDLGLLFGALNFFFFFLGNLFNTDIPAQSWSRTSSKCCWPRMCQRSMWRRCGVSLRW